MKLLTLLFLLTMLVVGFPPAIQACYPLKLLPAKANCQETKKERRVAERIRRKNYWYEFRREHPEKFTDWGSAALGTGIYGLFCYPFSIVAIIYGIKGITKKIPEIRSAWAGLILGISTPFIYVALILLFIS